jgi:hypothetical protein
MELIDGKGNILSTYKFRMEEGLGNGSLWTPNTGGQYTLRAYTSYQQNQKKKHFMERTFFVQKSVQQKLLITIDTDKNNYIPGDSIHAKIRITEPGAGNLTDLLCTASLVFDGKILHATSGSTDSEGVANLAFRVPYSFAESVIYLKAESSCRGIQESKMKRIRLERHGIQLRLHTRNGAKYLHAGTLNQILLKASDNNGNELDVSGWVVDQNENRVKRLESIGHGIIPFTFEPKLGYSYSFLPDGAMDLRVPFPEVKTNLPWLACSQENSVLQIETNNIPEGHTLWVSGQGQNLFKEKTNQIDKKYAFETNVWQNGVYAVTLTDEAGNTVLQEMVFIQNTVVKIDLPEENNRFETQTTKRIHGSLNVSGEHKFILSVVDKQVLNLMENEGHHVVSQLYLGHEFYENIEKPMTYFEKNGKAKPDLDFLLPILRDHWIRDYKTGRELGHETLVFKRSESIISGTIHRTRSYTNEAGIKVFLKDHPYIYTYTDSLGRFEISDVPSVDKHYLILVAKKGFESTEYSVYKNYISTSFDSKGTPLKDFTSVEPLDENIPNLVSNQEIPVELLPADKAEIGRVISRQEGVIGIDDSNLEEVVVSRNFGSARYATSMIDGISSSSVSTMNIQSVVVAPYFFYWDENAIQLNAKEYYQPPFGFSLNSGNVSYLKSNHRILNQKDILLYMQGTTTTNGKFQIQHHVPSTTGTYALRMEGITAEGIPFVFEEEIQIQEPVEIFEEKPLEVLSGDDVEFRIWAKNNTSEKKWIQILGNIGNQRVKDTLFLGPDERISFVHRHQIPVINGTQSQLNINLRYTSKNWAKDWRERIEIKQKGIKKNFVANGIQGETLQEFVMDDLIAGTLEAQFTMRNDFLGGIIETSKSMLREPSGCFEQVSSANYPNLVVLQFLRKGNQSDKEIERKAEQMIRNGYEKLVNYETTKNGFEWYGNTPPHQSLTAYGLLQFLIMKSLGFTINEKMFRRNLDWLIKERDGKGGFRFQRGKYGFSSASYEVNNAYITYVLSRIQKEYPYINIDKEIQNIETQLEKSPDDYQAALLANIYAQRGEHAKALDILGRIQQKLEKRNFSHVNAKHSVMRSYGKSLTVEVVALMLHAHNTIQSGHYTLETQPLVEYLVGCRDRYGRFGNTQATALALEALTPFAETFEESKDGRSLLLVINGKEVLRDESASGKNYNLTILPKYFKEGKNTVQVVCENNNTPYSLKVTWRSNKTEELHKDLPAQWVFSKSELQNGEYVMATLNIKNNIQRPRGQTVAEIYIPGNCSVSPDELVALKKQGLIDHMELFGNRLILYMLELGPMEEKKLTFQIKAEVAGRFGAQQCRVYDYYQPEIISKWIPKDLMVTNPTSF